MSDKLKFALALVILVSGIVGFYLLSEQVMVLRVLSVLVGLGVSIAVARKTVPGQQFFLFASDSVVEAKKVVWPSRKETVQATLLVFAFVLLMAIFLYAADKSIEWVLYDFLLGWRRG